MKSSAGRSLPPFLGSPTSSISISRSTCARGAVTGPEMLRAWSPELDIGPEPLRVCTPEVDMGPDPVVVRRSGKMPLIPVR